jgi:hypothetical protein
MIFDEVDSSKPSPSRKPHGIWAGHHPARDGTGIDLRLYAERPPGHRKWPALLRSWIDPANHLVRMLDRLGGDRRLAAIDPYGDTEYNEQQAEAALREVQQLEALCATDGERQAVAALRGMLADCAGTPGSYLMFVGD